MLRKTIIELNQTEILTIGKVTTVHYKTISNTLLPPGAMKSFRGFYDSKQEKVEKEVVEERILKYLRDEGYIDSDRWGIDWKPEHHQDLPNENGYRETVYRLKLQVSRIQWGIEKEE